MGIQDVQDVTLIRHAYVRTGSAAKGIGGKLLSELQKTTRPVLIGTWAAAIWAIRFYEKHGFRLVTEQRRTGCSGSTGRSPSGRSRLRSCWRTRGGSRKRMGQERLEDASGDIP